jgi:hypothetical protein
MTAADPDRDLPDPGDEAPRVCPDCRCETLAWWEDICRACDAYREAELEREP